MGRRGRQTGNLCRLGMGVGVEGSTEDKQCMQIGGHSCVLFQTRLWAWQAEQQALGWWRCTPRRALADGDDPVEGLSLHPVLLFYSCGL